MCPDPMPGTCIPPSWSAYGVTARIAENCTDYSPEDELGCGGLCHEKSVRLRPTARERSTCAGTVHLQAIRK